MVITLIVDEQLLLCQAVVFRAVVSAARSAACSVSRHVVLVRLRTHKNKLAVRSRMPQTKKMQRPLCEKNVTALLRDHVAQQRQGIVRQGLACGV